MIVAQTFDGLSEAAIAFGEKLAGEPARVGQTGLVKQTFIVA